MNTSLIKCSNDLYVKQKKVVKRLNVYSLRVQYNLNSLIIHAANKRIIFYGNQYFKLSMWFICGQV